MWYKALWEKCLSHKRTPSDFNKWEISIWNREFWEISIWHRASWEISIWHREPWEVYIWQSILGYNTKLTGFGSVRSSLSVSVTADSRICSTTFACFLLSCENKLQIKQNIFLLTCEFSATFTWYKYEEKTQNIGIFRVFSGFWIHYIYLWLWLLLYFAEIKILLIQKIVNDSLNSLFFIHICTIFPFNEFKRPRFAEIWTNHHLFWQRH